MVKFEDYLKSKTNNSIKTLSSFCGIKKTENPKWKGWAILNELKRKGMPLCSEHLDILVYNFYSLKYISGKLYL